MVHNLWKYAPELKRRARKQAHALCLYLWMGSDSFWPDPSYDIGYRAGRLMALRMEAYDRLHAAT